MTCAIKDMKSGNYYTKHTSTGGWYNADIGRARFFTEPKHAQRVIDSEGHHVAWPHNRELEVVLVTIAEL